ncbi:4Fe-4S binding protein [bacterium]|nr:4Fe-4S binding protein [bacterium]
MKKFFRIFRILIVAAAFAVAFFMMKEPVKSSEDSCNLDKEAAKQIFKTAETFEKTGSECVFNVSDASGKMLGRVLYAKPDETSVAGFGGNLRVVVGISPEGKIAGIELGENYESVGFIERVRETGFFEKWNGLSVEEAAKADVDTVSGATMSTRAIKSMVALNLSKYSGSEFQANSSETEPLWLAVIVFLLLAYSLFAFFFPQKTAKFRIIHLIALAVILGFIGGSALSFESFKNWTTSMEIALIPAVIMALAILVPLFSGKNFYCSFVCPFGAMQELFGRIPLPKKNLPQKFMKGVAVFKALLLAAVYILMIFKVVTDFTVIEPFSAFKFDAAALPTLILAASFLIVSLFINRPWCRFFCPTGTLLNMFAKKNGGEI